TAVATMSSFAASTAMAAVRAVAAVAAVRRVRAVLRQHDAALLLARRLVGEILQHLVGALERAIRHVALLGAQQPGDVAAEARQSGEAAILFIVRLGHSTRLLPQSL